MAELRKMSSFTSSISDLFVTPSDTVVGSCVAAWEFILLYLQPAYHTLKRRAAHILKALGVLLTLGFAGASLYYAKAAADDAHCQLEIQKRQYCETASDEMKQRYPCEEILARETVFAASFGPSCCCGGPDDKFWELLFAFPMPYFQSYGLAYCSRDLWGGWPWWHDWGTPYDLDFRPILWRFPDAYSASSVLTDPQAIPALLVGYGVLVWMDVGRIRARQSAHFWFICGVIVLSTLSFVLAAAETERQANYWETKTRATELSSKASNRTSRTWGDSPAQVTLWRPYRDYVLKWMESTQKGPLSIFDSKRATYMHLTPPYTRHFRWIWEPINVEPYISNDLY